MLRHEHALQECPFCGGFPQEIEDNWSDRDSKTAREALEKHVRDHLVDVALILAPVGMGDADEKFGNKGDDTCSEAQRDNDSERDLDWIGDSYELNCQNGCRDCEERDKDSVLNWSYFPATCGLLGGPNPQRDTGDPSYAPTVDVAEEWKFWYPISLPPDCQSTHPVIYPELEDDVTLGKYFRLPGTPLETARRDFDRAIGSRLRRSELNHADFLPRDAIQFLVTQDKVRGLLPDISPRLVKFACYEAPRVFLILWEVFRQDILKLLDIFQTAEFADKDLPLKDVGPICKHFDGEECIHSPSLGLFHHGDWSRADIERLVDAQWKFVAFSFTGFNRFEHIEPGCILPFTTLMNTESDNLYKVTIPKSHMDIALAPKASKKFFPLKDVGTDNHPQDLAKIHSNDIPAALKELASVPQGTEYRVERAWFRRLLLPPPSRWPGVDHLARIIGTFIRVQDERKRVYAVLEWAEGGNLVDFWRNNDTQSATLHQIRKYLGQLSGLCMALEQLHELHRGNINLKPTSILIFPTSNSEWPGVFKITGLGPDIIRKQETKTAQRYMAPEVARDTDTTLSELTDVWSMGCIIFESVVWLLYGKQGLEMFWANERQPRCSEPNSLFFAFGGGGRSKVNEVVKIWINHILDEDKRLKEQPRTLIGDLLTLVRDKLLVVQTHGFPSDPYGRTRLDSYGLQFNMRRIVDAADEAGYLATIGHRSLRTLPEGQLPHTSTAGST